MVCGLAAGIVIRVQNNAWPYSIHWSMLKNSPMRPVASNNRNNIKPKYPGHCFATFFPPPVYSPVSVFGTYMTATIGGKGKEKLNETYCMRTGSWEYRCSQSDTAGVGVQRNKRAREWIIEQEDKHSKGSAVEFVLCFFKEKDHATWKCNRSVLIPVLQQIKCLFLCLNPTIK